MAVILHFPAAPVVHEEWSMRRVVQVLLQAAVIIGCGICAGLMVWRWISKAETPAPAKAHGVRHLRKGGAETPIRSYRALRRA